MELEVLQYTPDLGQAPLSLVRITHYLMESLILVWVGLTAILSEIRPASLGWRIAPPDFGGYNRHCLL